MLLPLQYMNTDTDSRIGISRRTAEDDTYEGYFIPKGTNIVPNVW